MIGRIDIRANAAHPNFPLPPVYMFAGAPSSPRVFGVPARMGSWAITAVSVAVAFPDNSTRTIPLTQVDGTWIGVIPACATTGAVQNGVQIVADGTNENGDAVTGYCLGVGDLFVMERDFTATADGTRYYFHYCEETPATPQVGDAVYADGVLKWWDGTAWRDFGGSSITIDPSLSPTSVNPVQNKVVKAALDGKRGLMDMAVYEDGIAPWTMTFTGGVSRVYEWNQTDGAWKCDEDDMRLFFDSGSGWHLQHHDAEYDVWSDVAEPLEAAADALRLEEFEPGLVFTRPVAEGVYPTQDALARTSQLAGKADKSEMSVTPGTGADADKTTIQLKSGTSATVLTAHQSLAGLAREYTFSDVQTISSAGTEQSPNEVTPVDAQNKRVSVEAVNAYIAVALPAASANGHIRDFMLTLDCSSLTDGDEPTVTWGTAFHPRTDAGTDFACAAGVKNVYYISEYATGEFVVGGWQETAGGSGT